MPNGAVTAAVSCEPQDIYRVQRDPHAEHVGTKILSDQTSSVYLASDARLAARPLQASPRHSSLLADNELPPQPSRTSNLIRLFSETVWKRVYKSDRHELERMNALFARAIERPQRIMLESGQTLAIVNEDYAGHAISDSPLHKSLFALFQDPALVNWSAPDVEYAPAVDYRQHEQLSKHDAIRMAQ